ncbi:hypothetical protein CWI38_0027p0060 [Hamiltosporidium tvaerminnensis]|uniref:Uncharacterized protein n=1 Tax=Hamiltosporidium tvaerminnensis TaxID=1176355 RepID=A0A4Q9M5A1_9MICR|nr:hypothetical protein CWI38_0027p0060 [Hamiltosporidium tvaerminnensis]
MRDICIKYEYQQVHHTETSTSSGLTYPQQNDFVFYNPYFTNIYSNTPNPTVSANAHSSSNISARFQPYVIPARPFSFPTHYSNPSQYFLIQQPNPYFIFQNQNFFPVHLPSGNPNEMFFPDSSNFISLSHSSGMNATLIPWIYNGNYTPHDGSTEQGINPEVIRESQVATNASDAIVSIQRQILQTESENNPICSTSEIKRTITAIISDNEEPHSYISFETDHSRISNNQESGNMSQSAELRYEYLNQDNIFDEKN